MEEIVASILIITVFGYLLWCIKKGKDLLNNRDFTKKVYAYPTTPPNVPCPRFKHSVKGTHNEKYMLDKLIEIHRYAISMRKIANPRYLQGTDCQHEQEIRNLYALAYEISKDEGIKYIEKKMLYR